MRRPARLTPEQDGDLARMFRAGAAAREIAELYGVTVQAVHARLNRRGLHFQRRANRQEQLAIEMRRARIHLLRGRLLSLAQMARELRLSRDHLSTWMRRHMPGLHTQLRLEQARRARTSPTPTPPLPKRPRRRAGRAPQRARVRRDYLAGYSIAAIARHHRAHPWTIWRVLRRQGITLRSRTRRSPRWLAAMKLLRERRTRR